MKLLAVDTVASLCAACVIDTDRPGWSVSRAPDIGRGHAEKLFDIISAVLEDAGLAYRDLDRLCVCTGPGSFTGIRVGIASMRGMALALGVPLVGVTALEALAADAASHGPILAAIDARRGEVYAQLFDAEGRPSSPAAAMRPDNALQRAIDARASITGSGGAILAQLPEFAQADLPLLDGGATGDIETVARIGARLKPDALPPKPLYLRAPDAKQQSGIAVARRETRR